MKWMARGCGVYFEDGEFAFYADDNPEMAKAAVEHHNTDIAALEAERDELKRRLEAVLASLEPGKSPCDCIGDYGPECYCYNSGDLREAESWWTSWCNHRRVKAIAEGRTP